jgi:hypothetical protein
VEKGSVTFEHEEVRDSEDVGVRGQGLILNAAGSVMNGDGDEPGVAKLGTVAFCLLPIMIVLGVMAAIDALHRGVKIGPLEPAVSAAIPLIGIVGFTLVIYASWRARRRPDAHKRLILIATMGLVAAAFGRFPWARIGLPPAAGAVTGLGILIFILIIYELISIRRIHRSTMWAAPLVFASVALAVPIGMTPAWHAFAALLHRTIGPHISQATRTRPRSFADLGAITGKKHRIVAQFLHYSRVTVNQDIDSQLTKTGLHPS